MWNYMIQNEQIPKAIEETKMVRAFNRIYICILYLKRTRKLFRLIMKKELLSLVT